MENRWEQDIENISTCPLCGRKHLMKIHINSDWVNGPSCILEADGCYCTYSDCPFVCGNGPWNEEKRKWDGINKTWLNQYGQQARGTCRREETMES